MVKIDNIFEETFPLGDNKETITKEVLFDADALIALINKDDSSHNRALKINQELQKSGVSRYVSPFTVFETVTVLSHKISQQLAKDFLLEVRRKDYFSSLSLDEKNFTLADNWFLKQTTKGISYFDCYNMALMEKNKNQLEGIFSFDEIYKKNSFKTLF